jgi:hypothetical protein
MSRTCGSSPATAAAWTAAWRRRSRNGDDQALVERRRAADPRGTPSRRASPAVATYSTPVAALTTTPGHTSPSISTAIGDGVLRQAVEVVDGAVDRVDDPAHAGGAARARLLAQERVVGRRASTSAGSAPRCRGRPGSRRRRRSTWCRRRAPRGYGARGSGRPRPGRSRARSRRASPGERRDGHRPALGGDCGRRPPAARPQVRGSSPRAQVGRGHQARRRRPAAPPRRARWRRAPRAARGQADEPRGSMPGVAARLTGNDSRSAVARPRCRGRR